MFDVPFLSLMTIVIIVLYITSRRHRERMELIKRGIHPYSLSGRSSQTANRTLFFGLLGTASGLAFFLASFFISAHDKDGMVVAGLFCLFGGLALLGYWKLTGKDRLKADENDDDRFSDPDDKPDKTSGTPIP